MEQNGDGAFSFDPKTWGGGHAASPPAPPPRPPVVAKPVASAAAKPKVPVSPPAAGAKPPVALAAASTALLLIGGAVAAYVMRSPNSGPAVAGIAATAVAIPVGPINPSRRTLLLAAPDQIAQTLATSGIGADVANGAGQAALAALGKAQGEIRLVYDLVGPDTARTMSRLAATRDDGSGVVLTARPDGSFAQEVLQAKLTTQVKVVRGEMDATSFYNAAVTAGVTDSLISDFAKAFSYDFNFATDVHPGDIFEAAFEQRVNPSGEAVGPPTLVYVSLSTAEKSKALYRFLAPGETEPGWFDGNGKSTVTALMRTPVDGARISSGFGMRFHPVLKFNKMHKGTDFAAPIGTPIFAAGNGVIQWAAMKGPNGNLTILQHDNGWQTYYLHQSMFMPGVVAGARVSQGQKIGEIGTTGRSTGPHLHFEVHVNGEPVDPMGVDTGTAKTLDGEAMAAFRKERDRIDATRANPSS